MNIELLRNNFSAGSFNDEKFKNTWIKSASFFIPQLNKLLNMTSLGKEITDIEYFINDNSLDFINIFSKYFCDKVSGHNYQNMYSYVLNDIGRYSELNLLEIGIGTTNRSLVSHMRGSGGYISGGSLRAFREYLPNANIYGADVDQDILFSEDRIQTSYVDQLDYSTFENMSNNFGNKKFDIIIDDGLHSIGANLNTLIFALQNLKDFGWIVIEDILPQFESNWLVVDFILSNIDGLNSYLVRTNEDVLLYVVKKEK